MLVTGVIITLLVILGSFYFGDVSDQTTAIIILKTELLKQFSGLNKTYIISSTLEPTILDDASRTLCFNVKTMPNDLLPAALDLQIIKGKISGRTRYKTIEIKINVAGGCA